jgi:hypothetical protein
MRDPLDQFQRGSAVTADEEVKVSMILGYEWYSDYLPRERTSCRIEASDRAMSGKRVGNARTRRLCQELWNTRNRSMWTR